MTPTTSPAAPRAIDRRARRRRTPKHPSSPALVAADVVSYGYAAVVVWATMYFNLAFSWPEGIAIMVLFVLLRAVAHEIRRDLRRKRHDDWVRAAAEKERSPSRWSVDQREGRGRRVDASA